MEIPLWPTAGRNYLCGCAFTPANDFAVICDTHQKRLDVLTRIAKGAVALEVHHDAAQVRNFNVMSNTDRGHLKRCADEEHE